MSAPVFFSIIIPTYNRAALISTAISSVLAQTFADWELIIVDDGSKDNTKEVVAQFADPRIRYIWQANAERCVARNNGIDQAIGEYICFLDSDDYYLNNRLQLLYHEVSSKSFPEAMFYTGLTIDNGLTQQKIESQTAASNIYDRIALSTIHSQQTCIHRKILIKYKYDPQFYIGEDMELWLRIAQEYTLIYINNQFTVIVVEHEERSVNVKKYNSFSPMLKLYRYIFAAPHPGSNISPDIEKNMISNCYFGIAKYYIYKQNRTGAIINISRSIILNLQSGQLKFKINILIKLLYDRWEQLKMMIQY